MQSSFVESEKLLAAGEAERYAAPGIGDTCGIFKVNSHVSRIATRSQTRSESPAKTIARANKYSEIHCNTPLVLKVWIPTTSTVFHFQKLLANARKCGLPQGD